MKKLNYTEIMKEAERMKRSPYLIVKRKLNYRKAGSLDPMCKTCKSLNCETIDKETHTAQCETIGEGFDVYSEVNLFYTCDAHKK
jgi:hypothetical protein